MKKTYVQFVDGTDAVELYRHAGEERFALYTEIEQLYGGWLLATPVPTTLATLEDCDADCSELMAAIEKIVNTDGIWEELDGEDHEYVADVLAECGIEA